MSFKAVFLDRDDTLIEDPGYISRPEQVKLLPGTSQSLITLRELGFKLVVVSNQSGVARGLVTEKTLDSIHQRLCDLLAKDGAQVDRIYYCPFHPDGVIPEYKKESDLRKPNPGMLLNAAQELDIDLAQSWMVGNSYSDTTAGKRAGCRTILLGPAGQVKNSKPNDPKPDFRVRDITNAVDIIRQYGLPKNFVKTPSPVALKPQAVAPAKAPEPKPAPVIQPKPQAQPVRVSDPSRTEQILQDMLQVLKRNERQDLFEGDFSFFKLLALCIQAVVFLCVLAAVYFMLSSTARNFNNVFIAIGFGIIFQLMALTLSFMQGGK